MLSIDRVTKLMDTPREALKKDNVSETNEGNYAPNFLLISLYLLIFPLYYAYLSVNYQILAEITSPLIVSVRT